MVHIGMLQKLMETVLRLIHSQDSEGNPIAILTNRFDLEADEMVRSVESADERLHKKAWTWSPEEMVDFTSVC